MIHPIVAQMKPSEEQLLAIMDSGQDVIVTAGAGAGKTRTLVARYLRLLTESARLRSIVAITFTEKAAREMRNRVRQQIDLYLQNPAIDSHEKDRFQALYSELDSARISTIHSLCTEIVRGHPAELGIDPLFGVLDEGRTGILRGLALEDALNWAANDPQAVALFALLDERPLRKTVETLLTRRLEADEVFRKMPADLLRHWQDILEQRQREALTTLRSREEWSEALKDLQANQANDPGDLLEIGRQVALAAASAPLEPLGECLARMKELGTIRWDRGKAKAWPNGKEQVQNALHVMKELWKANADLLNLALNPQDERLAEAIPLLKTVYEYATARYQALKDERNVLDFDDLESRALELLTEHPDVRERWQRQVRAILVDEYQDTNARQNQLVELLNGGEGKLFVVGDAKQSIYAFRGADVAVFRQLRERARQHNGITRELRETYRAHPDLVEALNTLLKPVLGECQDPARPWIEPFAPLIAPYEPLPRPIPTAADGGEKMSCVEVHLGLGTKGNHALDLAADALAARLREMVEGKQQMVRVGGGTRYAEYGDIAVLCRASTAFSAYEDAFDRAGLPFLTVAGRGFYDRPEIRDLLNILTAVADPTDDLALVGALRSPVLALPDAILYQLRSQHLQVAPEIPFWEALRTGAISLPPDESPAHAERLQIALDLIGRLHDNAGRMAVADLLKEFLDETDYRAALILAGQARAARNVNKLLSDALNSAGSSGSGIISISEFLEVIADLRESGAREGEARSTSEGAIQIMSVHAAKGLEFPIVVIGDVTHKYSSKKPLLLDPKLGVLLPLSEAEDDESIAQSKRNKKLKPTSYALGETVAKDQDHAEDARLLYVAATRASERLILSGCVPPNSKPDGWLGRLGFLTKEMLAELPCDLENPTGQTFSLPLQVGNIPIACVLYEPGWEAPAPKDDAATAAAADSAPSQQPQMISPPLLAAPVMAPLSEDAATEEAAIDEARPERVWRVTPREDQPYAPGHVIGRLIHQALAAWRFPDEHYEEWARVTARGSGLVDQQQIEHAVRRSQRLLLRFRQHDLWREMNQAERRYHEVPYSLTINGRVQTGTMDVLYCQGNAWTVVEFKSDPVKSEDKLREFLEGEDYIAQVERYEQAVQTLLGVKPVIKLCMLDCGGRVVVGDPREWCQAGQECDASEPPVHRPA